MKKLSKLIWKSYKNWYEKAIEIYMKIEIDGKNFWLRNGLSS